MSRLGKLAAVALSAMLAACASLAPIQPMPPIPAELLGANRNQPPPPLCGAPQRRFYDSLMRLYPTDAADRGVQGWVQLRLAVTRNGVVEAVAVLHSVPAGVFDQAAVYVVSGLPYPAQEAPCERTIIVQFRLAS